MSSVQAQINNLEIKAINQQIDKDYSQPKSEEDHKKDRTAKRQEDIRRSRPQVLALETIPHNKGEYFLSSFYFINFTDFNHFKFPYQNNS